MAAFLFLLPSFRFVRVLTPRAQIIIAESNNAKETLKNIISFKMDRRLLIYSRPHVKVLASEFNFTIPKFST